MQHQTSGAWPAIKRYELGRRQPPAAGEERGRDE